MRRLALFSSLLLFACSSDKGAPAESDTDTAEDDGDEDESDSNDEDDSVTDASGPSSGTGGTDAETDASASASASESESETDDPSGSTTDDTGDEPTSPACGMELQTDWFAPYTASWGGETNRGTVDVNGTEREYIIEFPDPYDPDTPYPLILAFHGYGGTMDNIFGQQLAREFDYQVIVVYPQGVGATSGWSLNASSPDVDLFDALVDQIENELCVDRTRIFTWGFSAGGYFTHLLACVRGDIIDGSSPVSAGMPLSSLDCVGPVPQFIAHGDADTVVSISQGRAARDIWLNVNGCSDTTVPHETEPECVRYEDCESGDPVVWCELAGVGHGVHQDMGMEAPAIDFLKSL